VSPGPDVHPLLAIESSCDETAAAVIGRDGVVLSDVVRSQVADHAAFGGVVPELASRCHVDAVDPVVQEAVRKASISLKDLRGVAVTAGPGLVGCLLVGISYGQAVAAALDLPILGMNHLEGHLLAPFVGTPRPPYPFLALVVSGGHTLLVLAKDVGDCDWVGETRDDAAGEAFDKGARLLGLGYPGGVMVDRLAREGGDPRAVALPRAMAGSGDYDFSFSGLKTAVWQHVQEHGQPEGQALRDFCASLQEAIVDALLAKTRRAAKDLAVRRVVVTGGVAANSRLREAFAQAAAEEGWELFRPTMRLCTDNAAMIGYAASLRMQRGQRSGLDLDARPGWAFEARRPAVVAAGA
jgi:N6-L-threonylcarbamoyladenine synthase